MNTIGNAFRLSLFGESHGQGIGVVIDGCPAGLPLKPQDFAADLRRRQGEGPWVTARREPDEPLILSGTYRDTTTGAPLAVYFEHQDARSQEYLKRGTRIPRPGHADFTARHKYGGFNDPRGGGMFSGRLSVALVAAGVIAKKLIHPVEVSAEILEIGGSKEIDAALTRAVQAKDSLGGLIECRVTGAPVGLGEPFFDSVESMLSRLVFSIPGIKGIEFGSGFACSRMTGSACNDIFTNREGTTATNHAGGINGGITNGNQVVLRVAVRPTASIPRPQESVDLESGDRVNLEAGGRHDICFAVRVPVILEAAAAIVFADLMIQQQEIPRVRGAEN
jgi:chorismate synthase